MEFHKDGYTISTDFSRLDFSVIHDFLSSQSYWARDIPQDVVKKGTENCLCYGVYDGDRQIGFARIITDYATFAYLSDIFVIEAYRGKGISKWLMECIMNHPDLQNLRRWVLATRDAHGLYSQFGFRSLKNPEWFMELHNPDVYKNPRL